VKVFGHRGSPGVPRFGENTLSSFRKAFQAGADGVELDVRRCGDRTLVALHDATLDRTTNGKGAIATLSYRDIQAFDAGGGEAVPRLSDVLDEFGSRGVLHIELKESNLAKDVADMVVERNLLPHVVLSAFDSDDNDEDAGSSWADLSSVSATIPIALLFTKRKLKRCGPARLIESALKAGAEAIHPSRDSISVELISDARKAGLTIRVWTVNDPSEALNLRNAGVDAIFSDCPAQCILALH